MKKGFPVYDIGQLAEFKRDDILISRFAPYLKVHKNLQQAHKHAFYHLVFFTNGGGSQTIDFQRFDIKPFQVYFMCRGRCITGHLKGKLMDMLSIFQIHFFNRFY